MLFFQVCLILFLVYLGYCLYIIVILPYQKKQRFEALEYEKYIQALLDTKKTINETKQAIADSKSINNY